MLGFRNTRVFAYASPLRGRTWGGNYLLFDIEAKVSGAEISGGMERQILRERALSNPAGRLDRQLYSPEGGGDERFDFLLRRPSAIREKRWTSIVVLYTEKYK